MKLEDVLLSAVEEISEKKLYPYQRLLILLLIKSIINGWAWLIPVFWARQIGKTEAGKEMIITLMIWLPRLAKDKRFTSACPHLETFAEGFFVAFVGPVLNQAKIPFERIREDITVRAKYQPWLKKFGIHVVKCNEIGFSLSNGSKMEAKSAKKGSTREGTTYHFIWIEEAQEVSAYAIYKVFRPMLSHFKGTMAVVGTAGFNRCEFYEIIEKTRRINPERLSEIDCYEAAKHKPGYDLWIEEEKKLIDKLSFQLSYELKWMFKGGMLLSWDAFQRCEANGTNGKPLIYRNQVAYDKYLTYTFPVDFGKTRDSTVMGFVENHPDHSRLLDMLILKSVDHSVQDEIMAKWMITKERAYNDKTGRRMRWGVAGDAQGAGDPRCSSLEKELRLKGSGHEAFHRIGFHIQNKDRMYKIFNQCIPLDTDRPSKMLWYVADDSDEEKERFTKEMLDCIVKKKGDYMTFEAPTSIEDSIGNEVPHDDCVDMFMLACYTNFGQQKPRLM